VASSSVFQKTNKSAPVNTNKGYLNIIIFIAFLIGLLVWMIFVNRELDNNQLKQVETRPDDIKDESFKE
jgi:NADH:ubiquinone oxidoreductase subunit 3 (subunit A)